MAVQTEGRLKSFDSFANGLMHVVSGPRSIAKQHPSFTLLDMMFRPDAYDDADCIYVKNKSVRVQIAQALEAAHPELQERLDAFMHTGLLAPRLVADPSLRPLYEHLSADLIRTEKSVSALRAAMNVRQPEFLRSRLHILPDASASEDH